MLLLVMGGVAVAVVLAVAFLAGCLFAIEQLLTRAGS